MSPKGMTINYSMITNKDGKKEIGFRYNDTEGINIDKHYEDIDEKDIFAKLYKDVIVDMSKQTLALEEAKKQKIEAKRAEASKKTNMTEDYTQIIENLRKELENTRAELDSLKIDNEALNRRIQDRIQEEQKQKDKEVSDFLNAYDWLRDIFSGEFKF